MSKRLTVTLGVPVYKGEAHLAETLASIQAQTHPYWVAHISLDGDHPASEEICQPFLSDPRFRITRQPQRLGWVGNLNWLTDQVETPFWCYQQQDDVLEPTYLEVLVNYLEAAPHKGTVAAAYSDIQNFGARYGKPTQDSVTGTPVQRQLALLMEHHAAVAFRAVTRIEAIRKGGPIRENSVENFSCDTVWMSTIARWGELHRIPQILYRKRFHSANEHGRWTSWDLERRTHAWIVHCADMLEEALKVRDATPLDYRMLWLAAARRLTMPKVPPEYMDVTALTLEQKAQILEQYFDELKTRTGLRLRERLELEGSEARRMTREYLQVTAGPQKIRTTRGWGSRLRSLIRRPSHGK